MLVGEQRGEKFGIDTPTRNFRPMARWEHYCTFTDTGTVHLKRSWLA